MYAVVRTGGKQYKVAKDSVLKVESLTGEVGSKLNLEVLMLGGDKPQIGAPLVKGASVSCEILGHGQGEKVIAFTVSRAKWMAVYVGLLLLAGALFGQVMERQKRARKAGP